MTFRSKTRAAFAFSALAIGVATLSTEAAAASQIQGIQVAQPAANVTQLRIAFNGQPVTPTAYQQAGGNQLTLDFQGASLGKLPRNTAINKGVVNDVVALSNGTTARLMVNLKNAASYSAAVSGNTLVIDIVDAGAASPMAPATAPAPQTMNVQVNPLLVPANAQTANRNYDGVASVKYMARAGGGDISIALNNESVPVDVQRQGNKIVVRTTGSTIPKHLLRRLNANGLVGTIDANNQGKTGMITITMNGDYEYQAYQVGSNVNISVRPAKMLREPTIEEKVYKGQPLSMEFENVPVRTVLDVLARFTNLNIVASDAVQGEMTLRVINVPWDQVLDIILKSKNLDKRENGNVIIVGPADALAEQERKQLEEKKKIKDLIPLRTEYIRLNYAKAEDVMRLISEARNSGNNQNNGGNTLLSERGAVSIDARTNTLIVKDTTESINNIHEMIKKIDISVKQVMIEARIVNASDNFTKSLGVRWGLAMNRGDLQAGGSNNTLWNMRENSNTSAGRYGNLGGSTIATNSSGSNMSVDLGAINPAGTIALGLLSLSDTLLDLELSAMQADNRGEIISSPKVLTADKQRARISSGRQIPYQEASASGATTTNFIEAALSLEVTPNITPDGKIGLQLNVANADVDESVVGAISRQAVETNVVLEDGQTIVLGGVYRQTRTNGVTKVPFLGDLPYVGRLFKNNNNRNDKQELLIFITPKLVNDGVSRIN